jgi:hypothetical protein
VVALTPLVERSFAPAHFIVYDIQRSFPDLVAIQVFKYEEVKWRRMQNQIADYMVHPSPPFFFAEFRVMRFLTRAPAQLPEGQRRLPHQLQPRGPQRRRIGRRRLSIYGHCLSF